MATGKKTFIFYSDWSNMIKEMPNEDAGELLKHILAYVNNENPESKNLLVKMAFGHMKPMLKADLLKWDKQLKSYSNMGKKSAEARASNKVEPTLTKVKPTSTVNVNVNVNDNVNVNVDYKDIISEWNSFTWKLSKLKALNTERKKHLKIRIKEHGREELSNAFKKVKDSEFLQGENDSNWKANFDWVINSSNFVKIIEGNYDNQQTTRNPLMR